MLSFSLNRAAGGVSPHSPTPTPGLRGPPHTVQESQAPQGHAPASQWMLLSRQAVNSYTFPAEGDPCRRPSGLQLRQDRRPPPPPHGGTQFLSQYENKLLLKESYFFFLFLPLLKHRNSKGSVLGARCIPKAKATSQNWCRAGRVQRLPSCRSRLDPSVLGWTQFHTGT